jgi:hypothetical protein
MAPNELSLSLSLHLQTAQPPIKRSSPHLASRCCRLCQSPHPPEGHRGVAGCANSERRRRRRPGELGGAGMAAVATLHITFSASHRHVRGRVTAGMCEGEQQNPHPGPKKNCTDSSVEPLVHGLRMLPRSRASRRTSFQGSKALL